VKLDLPLAVLPPSKRELYREIWAGDFGDSNSSTAWFRARFYAGCLIAALQLRWQSTSPFVRLVAILLLATSLVATALQSAWLSQALLLSIWLAWWSARTDIRQRAAKMALAFASGYYLSVWLFNLQRFYRLSAMLRHEPSAPITLNITIALTLAAGIALLALALVFWIRTIKTPKSAKRTAQIVAISFATYVVATSHAKLIEVFYRDLSSASNGFSARPFFDDLESANALVALVILLSGFALMLVQSLIASLRGRKTT
jgi:hypothetical protein